MRRFLATALIAALPLACAAVTTSTAAATPATTTATTSPVTLAAATGPSRVVTTDPVGLSIEYPLLAADLGAGPCPPPAFVAALRALGSPTIRIGGDSEDETAPAGTPAFPGVSDLPSTFWTTLACLEHETGEAFVVGLNVASGVPDWAATMAAAARAAIPADRLSFEIGNEPDVYGTVVPWWNGTTLVYAPMPFDTYLERAEAIQAEIGPLADVEGPDLTGGRWVDKIPQIIAALSLQTVDTHFYPLNECVEPAQVTVQALLGRDSAQIDSAVAQTLALARAAHLPMVISEANSVACSGSPGVSNTPAAAVWALRLVINALNAGIGSVRFHSSDSSYDPFIVAADGTVSYRPLYRGLRVAVDELPLGAVVRRLAVPAPLAATAIREPDGMETDLVTNYGASPVVVDFAAAGGAELLRVGSTRPTVVYERIHPVAGIDSLSVAPATVVAITFRRKHR